jgi:hypothetical protein
MQPAPRQLTDAAHRRAAIVFWTVWSLALLLKLQLATLDGTIDVQLYSEFGSTLAHSDLRTAYASSPLFNHTPLTAGYCAFLVKALGARTLAFGFFLRLPGIVAEAVLAIFLWRRCRSAEGWRRWVAALLALNPISLGVTGFHGNVDGLLAVLLGAALLAAADERPIACGVWFALAANCKVAPVLLAPVFFFWWLARGRALPFAITAAVITLAGWSPGLLTAPGLFLQRVLNYGGLWGTWGISRLLYLTGWPAFHAVQYGPPSPLASVVATLLKLAVLATAFGLGWRRRKLSASGLVATIAAVWTVFLTVAPGGATQYAIWLVLPLLLYRVRLAVICFVAAIPLLIVLYPAAVAMLAYNFYPAIIEHWPGFIDPLAWTIPALFFWAVLVGILVKESRRWFGNVETLRVPSAAPALP